MIDHHSVGTVFADNYIDPTAAATGEIIFDISREFLARKLIKRISKKINECLYASISSDTGCFKYSNVTSKTHKIAAELMKSGIDTAEINRLLFDSKTFEQMKAENAGFDAMHIYYDGKVSVICFTYEMKESLSLKDEHLETLIDVARSVAGVEVAIAIRQFNPTNSFRVSTRASGNVDVSKICMHFGGGGHVKAAGCTITAENIQAAADMVLEEVAKQLKN
jgi:phosphoesterase RecJ-like protein